MLLCESTKRERVFPQENALCSFRKVVELSLGGFFFLLVRVGEAERLEVVRDIDLDGVARGELSFEDLDGWYASLKPEFLLSIVQFPYIPHAITSGLFF